jgi:hypothetical protein
MLRKKSANRQEEKRKTLSRVARAAPERCRGATSLARWKIEKPGAGARWLTP